MPKSSEQSSGTESSNGFTIFLRLPKKLVDYVARYFSAYGKVGLMVGGAAFNVERFSALVLNEKNGLDTPLGISLVIPLVTGVTISYYVIRFRTMARQKKANAEHLTLTDDECDCFPKYKVENAGWLTPDKNSNHHPIGYIATQVSTLAYMFSGPGLGAGYINGYYLIALLPALIPVINFHPACGDEESPAKVLIPAASIVAIIAYSNPSSIYYYDLERIRSYYHTYIFHGKILDISKSTWFHASLGVLSDTVNGYFSFRYMLNLVVLYALCHIGVDEIPFGLNEFILYLSVLVNFIVKLMLNVPAVHHQKNNCVTDINRQLAKLDTFRKMHTATMLSLCLNTLNEMISSFLAISFIRETALNEDPEIELSPTGIIMMVIAVLWSIIITAPNQYAMVREGYRTELISSEGDLEKKELLAALNDEENQLYNNTPSDSDRTDNDDYESKYVPPEIKNPAETDLEKPSSVISDEMPDQNETDLLVKQVSAITRSSSAGSLSPHSPRLYRECSSPTRSPYLLENGSVYVVNVKDTENVSPQQECVSATSPQLL